MAKKPSPAAEAAIAAAQARADAAKADKNTAEVQGASIPDVPDADAPVGKKEFNPPIPTDKQIADKAKAEEKAAAAKVKADAKAEKDRIAAEKKAAADKAKAEKAEAKAKERAEREARLAELGKNYKGTMLALADKVQTGEYVKGLNGQLRSNNELAIALDGIHPNDVIMICLDLLKLEDNPYVKLNTGQQSMNLRNRLRGQIKKDVITMGDVNAYIERNKIGRVTKEDAEATAKKKAEAKAAREKAEAEKKAKAAEAAAKPVSEAATA